MLSVSSGRPSETARLDRGSRHNCFQKYGTVSHVYALLHLKPRNRQERCRLDIRGDVVYFPGQEIRQRSKLLDKRAMPRSCSKS